MRGHELDMAMSGEDSLETYINTLFTADYGLIPSGCKPAGHNTDRRYHPNSFLHISRVRPTIARCVQTVCKLSQYRADVE